MTRVRWRGSCAGWRRGAGSSSTRCSDAGVGRALRRCRGEPTAEERGPLLEGLVHGLLRFHRERSELFDELTHWAPAETRDTEVDFVLSRGRRHVAVEVKTSRALRPADFKGSRAISPLAGLERRVLVFLGPRALVTQEGIDVLPFSSFAAALEAGTLFA